MPLGWASAVRTFSPLKRQIPASVTKSQRSDEKIEDSLKELEDSGEFLEEISLF